jgi:SH3 domain-containing YSC84-like protein 1
VTTRVSSSGLTSGLPQRINSYALREGQDSVKKRNERITLSRLRQATKELTMKRFILSLVCLAFCAASAFAAEESQLQKATNVLNEIMATPDQGIPAELLEKAVCVGIVPSQLKLALGIGGTYGRGVLVCRKGGNGQWDAPSMFTLGAASVGFQIGGKATDVVFIVMNAEGARKLVQDSVKLGAEASVAAGPVGRSAEGATDAQLHAEILSYSRTRGLFAGLSLDGAVMKQDRDDNKTLYGRSVSAEDILINGAMPVPESALALNIALGKYSPTGGQSFKRL